MNPDMTKPFRNLGNQINSLPHIKIGVDENRQDRPLFNPKEQDVLDKVKKYALIIVVAVIVCYAVYRIF